MLSDYDYCRLRYKRIFGLYPNLKNPVSFNEKIQWRKLYDRNHLYTLCSDKYEVRTYVKEKIGDKYLKPLIVATRNPKEIDQSILPNQFAIKANHGSGWNVFVKDKEVVDWGELLKKMNKWLASNYYNSAREWQYKYIDPMILIESVLLDDGYFPSECMCYCFYGKMSYVKVFYKPHNIMNIYDCNWKLLYSSSMPFCNAECELLDNVKNEIQSISQILSKEFDHVRVDLLIVKNKIFFNELTFTDGAGFNKFAYSDFDQLLGRKWIAISA